MKGPLKVRSHEVQPLKIFEVENIKAAINAMRGFRDIVFTSMNNDTVPIKPKYTQVTNNTLSISNEDICCMPDNKTRPPEGIEKG